MRKQMEINIESDIFKSMLNNLDVQIKSCLQELYEENFQSGEIVCKLGIELIEDVEKFPHVEADGDFVERLQEYQKPVFTHKVGLVLKKKNEVSGIFNENLELVEVDGKFIARKPVNAQISLEDYQF